ncbi:MULTISPECIES: 2OG-Fe(II) oxygenase [Cupriavidus]|uniref:2-oxoglutarate-dependent dioxygenase n=1 Tax=Cupriavidus pauculus TaxID=82633 RepID=A0A3G8H5K6_9BURK|nr:2OG-Fe(II) oxygenase [Cupriavidus pauculus]AZG14812.1 2-oxoglutarate-dependent dioxygenase [Cupriavidus pauculus]
MQAPATPAPSSNPPRQLAKVHFSPELRDWIVDALRRGGPPAEITAALVGQRFDPAVAGQLVQAFDRVLRDGLPMPEGFVTIERTPPAPGAARLPRTAVLDGGDRAVHVLSRTDRPVVAVLEAVLTPAECDALVAAARPRLAPSTLVDPRTGEHVVSPDRSSQGMFFRLAESPLLATIDARVAALMRMPVEHGEGLQVLHYGPGAQSRPHFDFLMPDNPSNQASIARSGQRVSTMVIYLNDVPEGGETVFPEIGLSVLPRKGNALYFEYCDDGGQLDGRTLHAAAAVVRGEKWVATKWMRQRRFVSAADDARAASM